MLLVDAECTPTGEAGFQYSLPSAGAPVMYRIGIPPAPVAVTQVLETQTTYVLSLFETLGSLRLLLVDRETGQVSPVPLEGARVSEAMVQDCRDPATVWVAASKKARLYRVSLSDRRAQIVFEAPDSESHLFALDALPDGTLVVGTYPGAKCFHIRPAPDGGCSSSEVPVDPALIGGRGYLQDVCATTDGLVLHYGTPALVVLYDRCHQTSRTLLESTQAFVSFATALGKLRVVDGERTLVFDRAGSAQQSTETPSGDCSIQAEGLHGTLTCGEQEAGFSLRHKAGGMRITCLAEAKGGWIVGGTYASHWVFVVNPTEQVVRGVGHLPGGCGQFYATGEYRGKVAIPSYHGGLYLFDPAEPFAPGGDHANPMLLECVPDVHYARACVTLRDGTLVYATDPEYGRQCGALVTLSPDGELSVVRHIGQNLTLRRLVVVDDRVFGCTTDFIGLGLAPELRTGHPGIVLELNPRTGEVLESVMVTEDTITALAPLQAGEFLVGTREGEVYAVRVDARPFSTARLATLEEGRCLGAMAYEHPILVLTGKECLYAFDERSRQTRPLLRFPKVERLKRMARGSGGDLFLAGDEQIYLIPEDTLRPALAD